MINLLRSLLFIPANRKKMLDKMDILKPDAFILDLEDSVPEEYKDLARDNILEKLRESRQDGNNIFIRINEIDSRHVYKDIDKTIKLEILGYILPKFENTVQLKKIMDYISKKEKEYKIPSEIKIILMIESSRGLLELDNNGIISDRIIGLALGGEDYLFSLAVLGRISEDMLDFARKKIILHAKAEGILSIDTVYKDFKDIEGLKKELRKIVSMGFNSKLAIHPNQIDIINSAFTPSEEEIEKMKMVLRYKEKILSQGAININGVMYDLPHLKWSQKIKDYLDKIYGK